MKISLGESVLAAVGWLGSPVPELCGEHGQVVLYDGIRVDDAVEQVLVVEFPRQLELLQVLLLQKHQAMK